MKKILFSIAAISFACTIYAQDVKFGVKAGLNVSTFTGEDSDEAESLAGFHLGGVAEIKFSDKFSLQPELLYSTQGAKATASGIEDGVAYTADLKAKVSYINLPVMAKYYVIPGFSLEAGPQVGFKVDAENVIDLTANGFGQSISREVKEDANEQYKTVDFGLNLGAGYELPIGLFFQARYYFGLSKIGDTYTDDDGDTFEASDIKNNVLQLSVGWKF